MTSQRTVCKFHLVWLFKGSGKYGSAAIVVEYDMMRIRSTICRVKKNPVKLAIVEELVVVMSFCCSTSQMVGHLKWYEPLIGALIQEGNQCWEDALACRFPS